MNEFEVSIIKIKKHLNELVSEINEVNEIIKKAEAKITPGYYSKSEAARKIGQHPAQITRAVKSGKLKVQKVGGREMIPTSELKKFSGEGKKHHVLL
jgi:hypothetical protein